MDHLIIIYLLLCGCGCGCGCGCWAIWGASSAPPRRPRGPPLEIRPPVWKDPPTEANPWLTFLIGFCVLQIAVGLLAMWDGEPLMIVALLFWSVVLVWIVRAKLRETVQLRIGRAALVHVDIAPKRAHPLMWAQGLMALGRQPAVQGAALEGANEASATAWARTS